VLNNGGGFYARAVYIQEAKRRGINILLPCINESEKEYRGKDKEIRVGLMAIKHLSYSSIDIIIEQRKKYGKYISLPDFIVRTKIGLKETQLLIKCGAMDCFGETRYTLLRLADIYFNKLKMLEEGYNDLFINEAFELEGAVKTKKDFSLEEKCIAEYEAFDYMVTRHPLEFFSEYDKEYHFTPSEQMEKYKSLPAGRQVKMIGWYMSSKRIRTKKGDIMKFLSLEDLTGTYEAVIFPRAYYKVAEETLSMGPYIVKGRIDAENSNNIIVENLDILANETVKLESYNDTAEKYYVPDDEGLTEGDIYHSTSLDKEKLKAAYAG
jgi:DNA polymerase III alpha subunit